MPTVLSHPVAALALAPCFGRLPWSVVAAGALCTVAPDLDVVGMRLGVPYDSLFGHRGFTHSILFAALLAGLTSFTLGKLTAGVPRWRAFLYLFLCTASHGLLDALTNGGHGIAFFAPFSEARFFFPWQPIQVSPLSISRFLSGQGWPVLVSELRWVVLPFLLLGVAARTIRRPQA